MLFLINQVLSLIPFKISSLFHVYILYAERIFVNTNIWLYRWLVCHNAWHQWTRAFCAPLNADVGYCDQKS